MCLRRGCPRSCPNVQRRRGGGGCSCLLPGPLPAACCLLPACCLLLDAPILLCGCCVCALGWLSRPRPRPPSPGLPVYWHPAWLRPLPRPRAGPTTTASVGLHRWPRARAGDRRCGGVGPQPAACGAATAACASPGAVCVSVVGVSGCGRTRRSFVCTQLRLDAKRVRPAGLRGGTGLPRCCGFAAAAPQHE